MSFTVRLTYNHGASQSREYVVYVETAESLLSAVEQIEEHEHRYPDRVRKLDETETH